MQEVKCGRVHNMLHPCRCPHHTPGSQELQAALDEHIAFLSNVKKELEEGLQLGKLLAAWTIGPHAAYCMLFL